MYINPLNNGDISDYNSLKKQVDKGKIIKKYQSKKLQTEPTELQKYYQYQTYQQPILDELNYVAERMRTEDIKKKTEDYEFTEKLKKEREGLMKESSKKEEDVGMKDLFDYSSTIKNDDITPVINTDVEMEYPTEPQPKAITISNTPETQALKFDLFGEGDSVLNDIFSIVDTEPFKEEKFELSRETKKKKEKKSKQLAKIEAKEEAKKVVEAVNKIKYAYKNKKAREEFINVGADKKIEEIKAEKEAEKEAKKEVKKEEKKVEKELEKFSNIPSNKRKGSKSKGNKGKLGSKKK